MASLVKDIDGIIEKHPEKKIGSYVNFLGDDMEQLTAAAMEFGEKHTFNRVPLLVPHTFKNGPKRLKLHSDAETTVIVYELIPGRVVKANHAFGVGGLNPTSINAIVADVEKHLP
ncbi:MAG: hypothetical protein H8E66_34650 [Planctomycetes bacterium]|nr:hypothetical protein [Planctomycetota bacterium]